MQLEFLRPGYLWGLLFLLIPIAIHFFNRRRTVRLDFSSLRFFTATAVSANRARNLRRLLLLLSRLGIVACVVLLFAWPHDPGDPFTALNDPQAAVYAWVDPTVSMEYGTDITCRREARELLDTLRGSLPLSAVLRVYDHGHRQFVPFHARNAGNGTRNYGPNGLGVAIRRLRERISSRRERAVFFAITDMQVPTTATVDSVLSGDSLPCPMAFVSVRPEKRWNAGITHVKVSNANPGMLEVTVAAEGEDKMQVPVYAVVGGMRTGSAQAELSPGDTETVLLEVPPRGTQSVGKVVLGAADPFALDDTCRVAIRSGTQRSVLVLGDSRRVYPIVAALGAADRAYWGDVRQRELAKVTVEDIDAAGLVIIDNAEFIPPAVTALLSGRGFGRKAIVYSPGLSRGGISTAQRIFEIVGVKGRLGVDSSRTPLTPVLTDTLSALWRGFPRLRDGGVAVYRWLAPMPGEPIVRLTNGRPLMSTVLDGASHAWVVCATPIGISDANNLPETGFYVALLDRIARYTLGAASPGDETWYAAAQYRNPFFGRPGGADVFTAAGDAVGRWESQPSVVLEKPGLYRIAPDGESGYWITVGIEPRERALEYRTPSVPPEYSRQVRILGGEELGPFLELVGKQGYMDVLWLVLGALVVLEILFWGTGMRTRPRSSRQ
jgi:hypothetical protein